MLNVNNITFNYINYQYIIDGGSWTLFSCVE